MLYCSLLLSPVFQRKPGDTETRLLVIQCDSGHMDGDLIACARYRIYDERAKSLMQNSSLRREGNTHVLFIIHLPRQAATSSFVGFQGDPWISSHIDDLRSPTEATLTLFQAMGASISDLFYNITQHEGTRVEEMQTENNQVPPLEDEEEDMNMASEAKEQMEEGMEIEKEEPPEADRPVSAPSKQLPAELLSHKRVSAPAKQVFPEFQATGYYQRLHSCIQAAASKLQDSEKNKARSTDRVDILVGVIPKQPKLPLG